MISSIPVSGQLPNAEPTGPDMAAAIMSNTWRDPNPHQ
jgi:hypothetical protein